jgi:hypothetical protein
MAEKKFLWAAIAILTLFSTSILVVSVLSSPDLLLKPEGVTRVALDSMGVAKATWNATAPRVFDGSFSARLATGGGVGSGPNASVLIGPVGFALSDITSDGITFWAYHFNDKAAHPHVNLVLDNGRTIYGKTSTAVEIADAAIKCEVCQGFPSADIWVLMKPTDEFYTSLGGVDPLLPKPGIGDCTFASPCTLATWIAAFPSANVVQVQIVYGPFASAKIIFIDDVTLSPAGFSEIIPVEPETISSSDV